MLELPASYFHLALPSGTLNFHAKLDENMASKKTQKNTKAAPFALGVARRTGHKDDERTACLGV